MYECVYDNEYEHDHERRSMIMSRSMRCMNVATSMSASIQVHMAHFQSGSFLPPPLFGSSEFVLV